MNNFKGGGFKKGGSKFGGKNKYDGDNKRGGGHNIDSRPASSSSEMFSATCSECGNKCEVPFRPSGDKPVYCSTCFGAKKNANESRGSFNDRDRADKSPHNDRPNNNKAPRDQRSPRHDPSRGRDDSGMTDLKRQIIGLDQKLNRILELINPPTPSKKVPTPDKEEIAIKTSPKKVANKAAPKVASKKVAKKAPSKKVATKKVAPKKAAKKAKK